MPLNHPTRRDVLRAGAIALAGAAVSDLAGADALAPITKPIPSSAERLPVIGLGTNQFSVDSAEEKAELRKLLEAMLAQGGSVIDTARTYGKAEEVVGGLVAGIGQRERFFLSTKTPFRGAIDDPLGEIETSRARLGVERIDLLLVHNLHGFDVLMPAFIEAKKRGLVRYIGMSTSDEGQYDRHLQAMRELPLDFIQIDYSVSNREVEERVLPTAQEQGVAVMVNRPLGGRQPSENVLARLGKLELPDWAAEIDATSWAQVCLKYLIAHPAVTVAIPGTTRIRHLIDNQQAGKGRLPDAHLRREIERYWDSLSA